MTGKLWGDVSNGKGSKRRIGSDQNKYNEGWQNIFGKPCSECGMEKGQHKMDCSMNWRKNEPSDTTREDS